MKEKINFKKLIDKYSEMIYHIAIGYLNNKEDAEDIVQKVFIKYIENINKDKNFNNKEHEKRWFTRVTLNLCNNEFNSAKRKSVEFEFDENIHSNLNIVPENRFMEIIEELDDKYKSIFQLFYIEELKISEISEMLNITEANVKTRLKRTRDKVRNIYKEKESYGNF